MFVLTHFLMTKARETDAVRVIDLDLVMAYKRTRLKYSLDDLLVQAV
jgi:hypothetical protein